MNRCKWCGKQIEGNIKEHEDICDLNDGGKDALNWERIENIYF